MSDTWMNNTDDTELEDGEIILEGKDVVIGTTNRALASDSSGGIPSDMEVLGNKTSEKETMHGVYNFQEKKY